MKAITLWQPYASLMAEELKKNETRSWATRFRGELAICAARRVPSIAEFVSMGGTADDYLHMIRITPFGCVVCVVNMFDCIPTDGITVTDEEREHGNYEPGRYAWLTRDCKKLSTTVPVVGRQGLFNLPPDVEIKVREQL